MPEPSACLVLIVALVQAHCRTMSRKDRDRFLADVEHALGLQEASMNVLRFRPREEDREVLRAMKQARAWWKCAISVAVRLGTDI